MVQLSENLINIYKGTVSAGNDVKYYPTWYNISRVQHKYNQCFCHKTGQMLEYSYI